MRDSELSYYKHKDYDDPYYYPQYLQVDSQNRFHKFRLKYVFDLDPPKKGEKIVDLGCGVGTFTTEAGKKGCNVIGIDMSPIAIHYAKKLFKKYGKGKGKFIVGSIHKIPAPNNSVDKIYMGGVIEHIPNSLFRKTLKEARRVLKVGGEILFECPAPDHILEIFETYGIFVPKDHTHIGLKNDKLIQQEFRNNGFKIIKFFRLPTHVIWLNPIEYVLIHVPFVGKYFVRRYSGFVRKI